MRKIKRIIIHCSDSEFGDAKLIDSWHKQKGWKGIGYHYCLTNGKINNKSYHIEKDGLIQPGRPLNNDISMEYDNKGTHLHDCPNIDYPIFV